MSELAERVAAHLTRTRGRSHDGLSIEPLPGGACQESFVVDTGDGRWVLRSDSAGHLPGSLRRRDEVAVITAARAAGVVTPEALWPADDLVREGAGAYFMPFVTGETLGNRITGSPDLARARELLPEQLMAELVRVHSVTPAHGLRLAEPERDSALAVGGVASALSMHRRALDVMSRPRPALELSYAWLMDHRPDETGELVLCHGDFRTGNFTVDAQRGLGAILDWEFAHWGPPASDLGWLCVRDWRFGAVEEPAFGLCSRDRLLQAYSDSGGARIHPHELHYWEVMGNLRWALGAHAQAERYRQGEHDIELFAIGRRAIEIEFECLRLIERGPR